MRTEKCVYTFAMWKRQVCRQQHWAARKVKGKFYNHGLEPPVVGDYVKVATNEYGDALIDEVLPRATAFKRPNRSGHAESFLKNLLEETIAANFDYVFIVTSLNQDYSENRIARYVSIT